jgi:micrococcal nuclease
MDELNPPRQHHKRRRRRVAITLSSALTALLAILLASTQPGHQFIDATVKTGPATIIDSQPGLWHVAHVVDGDTIDVNMGTQKETVRLLGIDTPETHDPRKPVQCFGEAASAHTRQLLDGKNVRLEPDPADSDRDKYGRLLRYVYLPDGTLINAALIRDGYAFAYTVFPLTKLDDFRALQTQAREANRGLWAGCSVDDSKEIKQTTGSK